VRDNLGSIFAYKPSKKKDAQTVLIDAHMDEVGFIVMGIEDNGLINIDAKGGI
jgi:putative aminopeptidase FrvX